MWVGGALKKTQGAHPDVQGWYGFFLSHVVLPHAAFWSYIVVGGEICVGLASFSDSSPASRPSSARR